MSLGNREVGIELRARDMASQAMASVGQGLQNVGSQADSTGSKFGALGRITSTVGQGMQLAFGFSVAGKIAQGFNYVKTSIIGYNQTLQDSTNAMVALSGDAKGVSDMISQLTTLANNSPFELPGLLQSSQMLVGLKFNMKDIPGMMTAIGNTAAATGGKNVMEKINSLTQGFVRMQAAGRVTGEVMEVMRNSGVPALDWLAKGFGVTSLEMQKMIAKGVVPADKAMSIMLKNMQSNYGGVAAAQAKTYTGAMSTIKDASAGLIATAFRPLFDAITKVAYGFGLLIQTGPFTNAANAIAKGTQWMIDATGKLVAGLQVAIGIVKQVTGGTLSLHDAIVKLGQNALNGIIGLWDEVGDRLLEVGAKAGKLGDVITPLGLAITNVATAIRTFLPNGDAFGSSAAHMGSAADNVRKALANLGSMSLERIGAGLSKLGDAFWKIGDRFNALKPVMDPVARAFNAISVAIQLFQSGDPSKATEALGTAFKNVQAAVTGAKRVFDEWLANVGPNVEKFVRGAAEALGTALPGALNSLAPVVEALLQHFMESGPKLYGMLAEWATKLVDWIAPAVPGILAALSQFGQTIFTWLLGELPKVADKMMEMGSYLVSWITDRVPDVITAISGWAQSLFDWLVNTGVPQAAAAIGPMALKFVDWVFEMLPKLLDALDQVIGAIVNFIATNGPTLVGKLLEWAVAFVGWIATEVVPRLIANLPTILRTILLFLGGAAGKIIGKVGEIGGGLVTKFLGFVGQLPGKLGGFLGQLPGKISGFIGTVGSKAGELGGKFLNGVIDYVKQLPGKIGDWIGNILSSIGGWANQIFTGVKDVGTKFVGGFISGLVSLPGKLYDTVREAFANLRIDIGPFHISASGVRIDMPNIKLPGFAVGAWNVPRDMPAVIHKGEMIVPANIASALRALGANGGLARDASRGSVAGGASVTLMRGGADVGGGNSLTIINQFGRDSIRSDDDITRISKEMVVQARMQGLTPNARALGSRT